MDNVLGIHNNYDAVFKEALMLYKNKTLDFLGLDLAMIEEPLNTEMTEIKVNKNFTDMCFMLKDKTGLHAEWEADISFDDMLRFCSYNLTYLRMYKTDFTTVVFTNRKQKVNCFQNEMIRFTPVIVNLGERDGDALLQKIEAQIENKEAVNELELIYLPLYHSKYKNVAELLEQVVELAPLVAGSKAEHEKIMIMSAVLANKFISEDDLRKIWEAIRMYVDDLLIVKFAKEDAKTEGKTEGKAEGKAEEKKEIALNMLDNGLDVETISKYIKLSVDEIKKLKNSIVNS